MPNRRTLLHPAAIQRIRQKLYADKQLLSDDAPPWLVRLERVQLWLLALFVVAWCALIVAAPVSLFFGLHYVVQWLVAAAWLVYGSMVSGGVMLVVNWLVYRLAGETPSIGELVRGLCIITIAGGSAFVLLNGESPTLAPLVVPAVALLVASVIIGGAIYRLFSEHETPLFQRIGAFALMAGLVPGILLSTLSQSTYFADTLQSRGLWQSLAFMVGFSGPIISYWSRLGQSSSKHVPRSLQIGTLIVATCLVVILVIILIVKDR